jgi:hypothetical protein
MMKQSALVRAGSQKPRSVVGCWNNYHETATACGTCTNKSGTSTTPKTALEEKILVVKLTLISALGVPVFQVLWRTVM